MAKRRLIDIGKCKSKPFELSSLRQTLLLPRPKMDRTVWLTLCRDSNCIWPVVLQTNRIDAIFWTEGKMCASYCTRTGQNPALRRPSSCCCPWHVVSRPITTAQGCNSGGERRIKRQRRGRIVQYTRPKDPELLESLSKNNTRYLFSH